MVIGSGISSGGALCVELWLKQVSNRISVPMFDIAFGHVFYLAVGHTFHRLAFVVVDVVGVVVNILHA